MCAERGLILVDTKYEFGRNQERASSFVIDEIHTPDSSRFWMAKTYAERFAAGQDPSPLDKDFVRRHYTQMGYRGDGPVPPIPDDVRIGAAKRYIEAFERTRASRSYRTPTSPSRASRRTCGSTPPS